MSGERGPSIRRNPEWDPLSGGHGEGNRVEIATPAIEYFDRMVGELRALATPGRYPEATERNAAKAEIQGLASNVLFTTQISLGDRLQVAHAFGTLYDRDQKIAVGAYGALRRTQTMSRSELRAHLNLRDPQPVSKR